MHLLILFILLGIAACTTDRVEPMAPTETDRTGPDSTPSIELNFAPTKTNSARTPLSGGATTVFDVSADAFSLPAPNLSGPRLALHDEGDEAFEDGFDFTSGAAHPGLGPVFDNVSCESCHVGDGRGRPPVGAEPFASMLFRSSVPGLGPNGGPNPVPHFGGQLQLRSVPGFLPDASAIIAYVDSSGTFSDGSSFSLGVPTYSLTGVRGPLPSDLLISPRTAPAVFGLGLLEAVPVGEVLALAAAQRLAGRVSGQPNLVWNAVLQRQAMGRFGWKANVPVLTQQNAGAYNGDMGVTSSLFPAESCEGESPLCARHAPEVDDATIAAVTVYTQTLGVPARRNVNDPVAQQGEAVFARVGCAQCHVQTLVTGFLPGVPEVSNQVIHPYTDLMVHDMGPELADNRSDFQANGREWRTAPLWGVGLIPTVNGHSRYLHDGRARNLMEAILWHGGEATFAREAVRRLSAVDRAALIAFLQSL